MRAVQLTGFGGLGMLRYREDVPVPRPATQEVRVRVTAAGINNTDVWTRQGAYGTVGDSQAQTGWRRTRIRASRASRAPTSRVTSMRSGPEVSSDRVGQRVLIDPMLYFGDERELAGTAFLGSERDGGFAEWVTVPAMNAHRVDSGLTRRGARDLSDRIRDGPADARKGLGAAGRDGARHRCLRRRGYRARPARQADGRGRHHRDERRARRSGHGPRRRPCAHPRGRRRPRSRRADRRAG